MGDPTDKSLFEFEVLKRYGARWAVLAAMMTHMTRQGVEVPRNVFELVQAARSKIASGCFSPCEVACDLAQVEAPLFSQGYLLDQEDFQQWSDLLAAAMQGKLDYEKIMGIPALRSVKNDCEFLGCKCSSRR